MKTAFISGHLDLTEEEFNEHYKPAIDFAIFFGTNFVVGDANGADKMAQEYIKSIGNNVWELVTVFHMFEKPRNNCGFKTRGGYKTDDLRDNAMTVNSDYDIAWVRPGREKSGTAKNLKRRKVVTDGKRAMGIFI
jgi:hypothetical protein